MTSERLIRVIYITPGGLEARGGIGRFSRYLLASLAKLPNPPRIEVLDSYGEGQFVEMLARFLFVVLRLTSACLLKRADVVHLHMSHRGSAVRKLVLLRLAHAFRVPTVLHLHGSGFAKFCQDLPPGLRRMIVKSMRLASQIVVIGSFWEDFVTRELGIDPARVTIIHNGVPLDTKAQKRQRSEGCHLLSLGALGPRKGTPDLLAALATPIVHSLDWRMTIAGNGEVEQSRSLSQSLGLSDRVTFPGWQEPEQVAELLHSSDIFLLPSHFEGLPVAILEAMAAGLPVIATPVGAIPDAVREGITGILVPAGAPDQLADAIVKLVTDRSLSERMGEAGRDLAESQFSIEAVALKVGSIYERLCGYQ